MVIAIIIHSWPILYGLREVLISLVKKVIKKEIIVHKWNTNKTKDGSFVIYWYLIEWHLLLFILAKNKYLWIWVTSRFESDIL